MAAIPQSGPPASAADHRCKLGSLTPLVLDRVTATQGEMAWGRVPTTKNRPASTARILNAVNRCRLMNSNRDLWSVEEGNHRGGERGGDVDVVVRQARQDGEAVVRHPGAVPAGIALAATEQLKKLHGV